MVNKITDGISIKLDEIFGDGYEIYSEDVEQGLNEPCFFILSITQLNSPKLGNRSFKEYLFDIHYFPLSDNEKNKEINDVIEKLIDGLEYIRVDGDLISGTKIHTEVVEGVLHFFINYNLFINKQFTKSDDMESIKVNVTAKR